MFHGGPRGDLLNRETSKPKRAGQTLARLARRFTPYWPMLVLAAFSVVLSTWAQVTSPQLTGQLVDCYLTPAAASAFGSFPGASGEQNASQSNCWLQEGRQPSGPTQTVLQAAFTLGGFPAPSANAAEMSAADRIAGIGRLIALLISLYVGSALLTGGTFYAMTWSGQHVLRQLRVAVFEQLHRLSLSYYAEHEAGDLMSRITNDSDTIQQVLNFALVSVASGALLLVWVAYNMLTENLVFALLSMAVTPIMLVATLWFSSQARRAFRTTRREIGAVNAELQENIAAVREVQAFNRAEENIEAFKLVNAANRDANVRAVAFSAALSPALEALGYVALAAVTVTGGLALLGKISLPGGAISLGLVITFLGYVQRFNQPIQQISVLWTNIQSAVAGAERIFGLLDEEPAVQDAAQAVVMAGIRGRVEFDHVSAEYLAGQPVLKDVSFAAEPGQTIAIVGPTGAGKTTIINLIPRFYDVTGGAVRIDGSDVRDVTTLSLREQIGIVLQDTFLFSTTVMENIRFGRPTASDEEVVDAARLAHADTFIERLPDKYQTTLGERGSGLSLGQRQLLAIARAALADPRILILDEATSSVDTRTERLIQRALERLLEGRTSFVIAHRLSTIRNADLVLVINEGQIVERGTHDELLAHRGVYHGLYMSQFRRDPQFAVAQAKGDGRAPEPASAAL
ncbi:MAG: ABC transporter [Chloroflexi bacterium RBG_13_68_17]|nr:MAG: ABC transporter [Chloroflexi bacterium RBG_13_68_17]